MHEFIFVYFMDHQNSILGSSFSIHCIWVWSYLVDCWERWVKWKKMKCFFLYLYAILVSKNFSHCLQEVWLSRQGLMVCFSCFLKYKWWWNLKFEKIRVLRTVKIKITRETWSITHFENCLIKIFFFSCFKMQTLNEKDPRMMNLGWS